MIFKESTVLVDAEDYSMVATEIKEQGQEYIPIRSLVPHVPADQMQDILKAYQLFHWKRRTAFCGVCGAPNTMDEKEGCRLCPDCGEKNFPYLFPAIIVSIIKDGKILLAHNANFPRDLHSVIAGFVDIGENLEETVVREIREEVGLEVKNVTYVASQNWGYTSSLMVAFTAEYESGEIRVDGTEIVKANWYDDSNLPELPPEHSIGRFLIERFLNDK